MRLGPTHRACPTPARRPAQIHSCLCLPTVGHAAGWLLRCSCPPACSRCTRVVKMHACTPPASHGVHGRQQAKPEELLILLAKGLRCHSSTAPPAQLPRCHCIPAHSRGVMGLHEAVNSNASSSVHSSGAARAAKRGQRASGPGTGPGCLSSVGRSRAAADWNERSGKRKRETKQAGNKAGGWQQQCSTVLRPSRHAQCHAAQHSYGVRQRGPAQCLSSWLPCSSSCSSWSRCAA